MVTKQNIIDRFKESIESEKIELDNLDWAKLVFNKEGDLVVENEHGTQFDIEDLSKKEMEVFYAHI